MSRVSCSFRLPSNECNIIDDIKFKLGQVELSLTDTIRISLQFLALSIGAIEKDTALLSVQKLFDKCYKYQNENSKKPTPELKKIRSIDDKTDLILEALNNILTYGMLADADIAEFKSYFKNDEINEYFVKAKEAAKERKNNKFVEKANRE